MSQPGPGAAEHQAPHHEAPRRRVSRLRAFASGVALATSVVLTGYGIKEVAHDGSALADDTEEAGEAAAHLINEYDHFSTHPEDMHVELDPSSGRITASLRENPNLDMSPIKEAFSQTDKTKQSTNQLKLFIAAGLVGLATAAWSGRWDRALGRDKETSFSTDLYRRERKLWLGMLALGGVTAGIWAGPAADSASKTKDNIEAIHQFDASRAFGLSDSIAASLKKLDVQITQDEVKGTTKVSFLPDAAALAQIQKDTDELASALPELVPIENTKENRAVPLFGGVGALGLAVTALGGRHDIAEAAREVAGSRRARRAAAGRPKGRSSARRLSMTAARHVTYARDEVRRHIQHAERTVQYYKR